MFRGYASFRSLLWVTAFACLFFAFTRIAREVSFPTPVQRPTTGIEEEPLFGIWKVTQGQPVYTDAFAPPYALTIYNWLFYASYGAVAKAWITTLGADSQWLPTITRFLTLFFASACTWAFCFVAKEAKLWPQDWGPMEKVSLAVIAIWSPLSGLFVFSARPDMAALLFELLGLALLFRYLRAQSLLVLVLLSLTLFCAWSFKQTSSFILAGVAFWLVLSKRYRDAALVTVISTVLYGIVFLLGGKYYTYAVLGSQGSCEFGFAFVRSNLEALLTRAPFLIVALGLWLIAFFSRDPEWRAQARNLPGIVLVVTFLCYVAISTKRGAGANYFITPSVLAMLWMIGFLANLTEKHAAPWLRPVIGVAVLIELLAAGFPLLAQLRHNNAPVEQERHRQLAARLVSLEAPVLVDERFDNLPWIQRKPPHFVYSYAYWFDRLAGKTFASGGLGGLIRAHYFRTIVLRNEPQPQTTFDNATLDGYQQLDSSGGYDFYVLREKTN